MSMNPKTHYLPYLIYYATVVAFALSTRNDSLAVFGFSTLRYTPGNSGLLILLAASLIPLLTLVGRFFEGASNETEARANDQKLFIVLLSMLTLAYGAGFVLFRCQSFFLGDSYTALAEFTKNDVLIKYREFGAYFLQLSIRDLLGEVSEKNALLSFRISSTLAGVLFLISLSWITIRLFDNNRDRFQFWMGIATGGYMLLFFGYVEFYAWLVLSVAVFSFTGLLVARGAINKWILLIPLSMAVFFHVLGFVLLPATIYLLIKNRWLDNFLDRLSVWQKTLIVSVSIISLYALLTLAGAISTFISFALLPITDKLITVDNYTLFSIRHLFDFVNLLFLLLPGLAVALILFFTQSKTASSQTFRFMFILTVSSLFAVFIIDPKLGMPRDWDLLSFAAVPLAILLYYIAISAKKQHPKLSMVAPLMILLGMMSLSGRVLSQIDPLSAETQFKDYLKHDPAKSRNGHLILIDYYEQKGDLINAVRESNLRKSLYPQEEMLKNAMKLIEQKRFDVAVSTLYKAIKIDPQYWNLWLSLGSVYLEQNKNDSALIALEIAEGLNPHSPDVKSQMARIFYAQKNFIKAERLWLKAVELDSKLLTALMGLATLYHETDNIKNHVTYLTRAAACDDANYGIVANLADYYISVHDFSRAARLYNRALAMGLDSAYYNQMREQHPELGR